MTNTAGDTYVPLKASYIISIIINSVSCPFTVLLHMLVIMAVKRRSRLRTNSNILLACLAVADALTGLFGQPSYVLWRIFLIFGLSSSETLKKVNVIVMTTLAYDSCLHLMLITFERLIAIKFTMQYSNVINDNKLKITVLLIWIISLMCRISVVLKIDLATISIGSLITISCIFFVVFSYVILYCETRRQQRKIKAQQLPQEGVERFSKENKAFRTTVFVVGAVIVCLLPLGFCLVVLTTGLSDICPINEPLWQTFAMLNSLFNPLIYCWRQKEMKSLY